MKSPSKSGSMLFVLFSLFLCLTLFAAPASAAVKADRSGPLTPPPPASDSVPTYIPNSGAGDGIVRPFSEWDPNQKYLSSGVVSIGIKDGKLSYYGITYATQTVDQVGVKLTIQRWNGSSWTDIYSSKNYTSYDDESAAYKEQHAVTGGYYYRIKSFHWVFHGTTYEYGEGFSEYLYME